MGLAWGGFANGAIPLSQLVAVPNFHESGVSLISRGSNLMKREAAFQLSRMMKDFYQKFKVVLSATEVYRPLINQDYYWDRYINKKPGWTLAAKRGTSIHGWALSVDLNVNGGNPSGAHLAWLRENAAKYGFVNDVASEVWHWSYRTDRVTRTIVQTTLISNPQADDTPSSGGAAPAKKINWENDMPRLIRVEEPSNKALHGRVSFLFPDREIHTTTKEQIYRIGRAWGLIPPSSVDKAVSYAENISSVEYNTAVEEIENNQQRLVNQAAAAVWGTILDGWNGKQPAINRMVGIDQKAGVISDKDREKIVNDVAAALKKDPSVQIDAKQIAEALVAMLSKSSGDVSAQHLQS